MAEVEKTKLILKGKDGKKVVYEKKDLTAGDLFKALECQEKMYTTGVTMREQLDILIDFNVDLFNQKGVNRDSILKGLSNLDTFSALNGTIMDVLGIDETAEANEKK